MVQLRRLPAVELVTGTELDEAAIRADGADLVVIATGASWARDGLNGFTRGPIPGADADLPWVLTPEQVVLEGKRPPGRRVAVFDGEGYFTASAVAELLAAEGAQAEFVTGYETVAPFCAETLEDALVKERLHELGVGIRRGVSVTTIREGKLECEDEFGEAFSFACDGIVLATQRVSRDGLFRALEGSRDGLYRIGDCVAPRLIAEAVFDGHRLAREIDAPNPEVALPYLRERPFMETPGPAVYGAPAHLAGRPEPQARSVRMLDSNGAAEIASLLRDAGGDAVVCAGRGADVAAVRALAERYGARLAVSRPHVEAGRATRLELVGASSNTVAPGVYLALGVSGALPHLIGMQGSGTVVAVNRDPGARIFDYADVGVVGDSAALVEALSEL
jgi:hypothetical protein